MKKFISILASAMAVLAVASCGEKDPQDGPDTPGPGGNVPTVTLTPANIDVTGIDGDYLAVVDMSAKTLKITLGYGDKENAKALTVSFIGLPEGVTAEYQRTFNYSDGATQTVAFKFDGQTILELTVSVSIGAADPKFVSLTVAGEDALSGEVQLASAAALSHLVTEFKVDPANTVVSVNGQTIESGAELDFSDKLNGVTFTLTCGEAVKTHKVVVITSGIRNALRVWGHYAAPKTVDDDWFQTQAIDCPVEDHWLRTVAMDDQYMYLAQHKGSPYGAYVLNLSDGSIVKRLSTAIVDGGTHALSAIRTIPDGDGGTKILECNLVVKNDQQLKVYKWDSADSEPTAVLTYLNADGLRLGDKMSVSGTWKDGEITFLATTGTPRKLYIFKIKDGVVSQSPSVVTLGDMGKGTYGQIYRYSDTETLATVSGTKPISYTVSGDTWTQSYADETSLVFGSTDQGFNFFSFNDKNYMAFMHLEAGLTDGSLRIAALTGETLAESLKALDSNHIFRYGIGDPNECPIAGNAVGNSVADCTVRVINGETYIAAVVADGGVSLFKLEK